MDLITDLPISGTKQNILTVIDRFSKMAHFLVLGSDTTAQAIAHAFFYNIVRLCCGLYNMKFIQFGDAGEEAQER